MDIKRSRFQKVHGRVALEASEAPASVEMIVKVAEDGYVPSGVRLRARVDPKMFTAEASPKVLDALEQDPKVTSVSVSRPLNIIE